MPYQSVAYDPDDGRSTLTIPGVAWFYGTGDDWLYTWRIGGRDSVIDSRSGATLFTGGSVLADHIVLLPISARR